jgi:hypothetical protein
MFAHFAISSKHFFWFARFFEQKCEQKCEQTPLEQVFLLDVSKKTSKHERAKPLE